jgi:hypothetical protein
MSAILISIYQDQRWSLLESKWWYDIVTQLANMGKKPS